MPKPGQSGGGPMSFDPECPVHALIAAAKDRAGNGEASIPKAISLTRRASPNAAGA